MRIRIFGQYVHLAIGILAATEATLFFGAFIAAAVIRFPAQTLGEILNTLWPQALLFGVVMVLSLLALGLYSSRQRARAGGLTVRVIVAVTAGVAVTSLFFYLLPSLFAGRGIVALAAAGALLAAGRPCVPEPAHDAAGAPGAATARALPAAEVRDARTP